MRNYVRFFEDLLNKFHILLNHSAKTSFCKSKQTMTKRPFVTLASLNYTPSPRLQQMEAMLKLIKPQVEKIQQIEQIEQIQTPTTAPSQPKPVFQPAHQVQIQASRLSLRAPSSASALAPGSAS
jgi:hypothetical protein